MRKQETLGRMDKWSAKLITYDIEYLPRTTIKSQALTDFVVDFSDDVQPEVELEIQRLQKEKSMGEWLLFKDGASNFKGTCLGIILKSL